LIDDWHLIRVDRHFAEETVASPFIAFFQQFIARAKIWRNGIQRLHTCWIGFIRDNVGGSVTLIADLRPTDLKDGQYVRVEGRLDPEARGISPAYKVVSIRALDR